MVTEGKRIEMKREIENLLDAKRSEHLRHSDVSKLHVQKIHYTGVSARQLTQVAKY